MLDCSNKFEKNQTALDLKTARTSAEVSATHVLPKKQQSFRNFLLARLARGRVRSRQHFSVRLPTYNDREVESGNHACEGDTNT